MHTVLRIGTRGSQLALWQARAVATRLEAHGTDAELVIIRTTGDRLQEAPLSEVGGKRLFVKELEDALLRNDIDVAVHSAKDMPAVLPDGLAIAATLPREDPRDVVVVPAGAGGGALSDIFAQLGAAPRIGTSSVRRSAQLAAAVPGAAFLPIRGNVDTRLRKLDAGEYDMLVLACAGMHRLGFSDRISAAIPVEQCVPAPGQGIVAVEIRADDEETRHVLRSVHDTSAAVALEAERTVVAALGGGCQLPLGALAAIRGRLIDLQAIVCSPDGSRVVRAHAAGPTDAAARLGQRVADDLAAQGAGDILDAARRAEGPVQGSY
jgi:hydroxymethylbilane synthase